MAPAISESDKMNSNVVLTTHIATAIYCLRTNLSADYC